MKMCRPGTYRVMTTLLSERRTTVAEAGAYTAADIISAIESATSVDEMDAIVVSGSDQWRGREHGLSQREAQMLALISQGLSNREIAQTTYLSINSVKTYVRAAYRKIGVARRSQAVRWALQHGVSTH
jgi:DNA-binding CsgD family transcriptional regulator